MQRQGSAAPLLPLARLPLLAHLPLVAGKLG
jgi:hypothetical protein